MGSALTTLLPLTISEVSTSLEAGERALFAGLLRQYHYLSHRSWVGQNLQYLARDAQSRPVACLLFGAAAWQCADRDCYIGWDAPARQQQLHLLANNSRLMILPRLSVFDRPGTADSRHGKSSKPACEVLPTGSRSAVLRRCGN